MNTLCPNCGNEIKPSDKFCQNCGTNLSENKKVKSVKEIIVSTGEIKKDYDVMRPIHLFHHSLTNKEKFGEKIIPTDQVIDKLIEEMKEEAEEAGGDAILFLRVDFEQMQLGGTQYFVYGTLVKFK